MELISSPHEKPDERLMKDTSWKFIFSAVLLNDLMSFSDN